ncbi:MAG: glycosyltransferase family 4 protein [Planctomycetes bacterium]|nr:glycosyltransferase family 4 protein [Planctomycetota bacterium]
MKIVYLAAGAAGQYCGACARDAELARNLIDRGHDVTMLPLYTPLTVDGPDPSDRRVFYGGISAFLQQKFSLFRHTPKALDRVLDSRWLLRAVSRLAVDTKPEDLGAMTVSVLRGRHGRQAKELRELLEFLERQDRPDVVNLSNSLLSGLVPAIRERLGCRIVCTVQGEESFIHDLPHPFRDEALDLIRSAAEQVDLFISPAAGYAAEIGGLLRVPPQRIRVVRPGVDLKTFRPADRARDGQLHVGYLSRIAESKGTDVLCQAMALVARRCPGAVRLTIAGQLASSDESWWHDVLEDAGLRPGHDGFEFRGRIGFREKIELLQSLDLFVRPSRLRERRAIAALEAMACGAPLLAPRNGVLTEIVDLTGGGTLVDACEAKPFAEAIIALVDDRQKQRALAAAAARGVAEHFSSDAMAEATLAAYTEALGG